MGKTIKKLCKKSKKTVKKGIKSIKKGKVNIPSEPQPAIIRFSECIKGILYLILSVSIILAVIIGESGIIIQTKDLIENLFVLWIGRVIIVIIALGFFGYGLKQLKLITEK